MSEKRHEFCHDRIGGIGEIAHRCEKDEDHQGPHRCSCGEEWTFAEPSTASARSAKPGK